MRFQNDPEGRRLPVKLDTTTNGEYAPIPLAREHREANLIAHEAAGANARKLGLSRRGFLVSAAGAASTLLAMNTPIRIPNHRPSTGGFPLPRSVPLPAPRHLRPGSERRSAERARASLHRQPPS